MPSPPDFGHIELDALLGATAGVVSGTLIDAGMVRPYSQQYEFSVRGDALEIVPANRKRAEPILLPKKLPLTFELLAMLGMYSGDGNKTGNIGFAQANMKLMDFVVEGQARPLSASPSGGFLHLEGISGEYSVALVECRSSTPLLFPCRRHP